MKRLIAEGDTKSPMPAFRDRLSPEEIDAVARYVQSLHAVARKRPSGIRNAKPNGLPDHSDDP